MIFAKKTFRLINFTFSSKINPNLPLRRLRPAERIFYQKEPLAWAGVIQHSIDSYLVLLFSTLLHCPNMVMVHSIFVERTQQISCDIRNFVCRGEK